MHCRPFAACLCSALTLALSGTLSAQTTLLPGVLAGNQPALSGNGRFVAYVEGGGVKLYDRHLATTERVDKSTAGVLGNNFSQCTSLSADARYVAFVSFSDNLVTGDTNFRSDVFVRDRQLGQTTRVSVTSAGAQASSDYEVECPVSISGDGRYVAFVSNAPLAVGDGNYDEDGEEGFDVYVRDRVAEQTIGVSVSSSEAFAPSGDGGSQPRISRDGRYIAFLTLNAAALAGATNSTQHVLVRDLVAGVTTLVSRASDGTEGNSLSRGQSLSGDGRYVAFYSVAGNLVAGDPGGLWDAFVHDRNTGTTTRVSVSSAGMAGNANTGLPAGPPVTISDDGRYVAFHSDASNLVPGDTNGAPDVFVRDRLRNTTRRASVRGAGEQVDNCYVGDLNEITVNVALSANGGDVMFGSSHVFQEPPTCFGRIYLRRLWPASPGDVTADGRADLTVFRPAGGLWYTYDRSSSTWMSHPFGVATDVPVAADYDGDMKTDFAVFRPSSGAWFFRHSWAGLTSFTARTWGVATDVPVPADYDRDGKADLAVYRPSTSTWHILKSSSNFTTSMSRVFGLPTDVPVPGDYDGDRQADLAVFRPSSGVWYILLSATNYTITFSNQFGVSTDRPVPGDYDGDGRTDFAVYRPVGGVWYVLGSVSGVTTVTPWGIATDTPVPGDFNGDGTADLAVFRGSSGLWYVKDQFVAAWGTAGDIPVLKR